MSKTHLALVASVVALVAAAPAAADPAPGKDACKKGGYANFSPTSGGLPFGNQGQCVSHVNRGGTLHPFPSLPSGGDTLLS